LLGELVVSLQNLELLPIDWVLCFEVNLVGEVLCQTQIVFVDAERVLVFVQDVAVSFLVFVQNLMVASFLYVISGKSFPLHFWKAVVDDLTY
jgi:hypothetical protein